MTTRRLIKRGYMPDKQPATRCFRTSLPQILGDGCAGGDRQRQNSNPLALRSAKGYRASTPVDIFKGELRNLLAAQSKITQTASHGKITQTRFVRQIKGSQKALQL